MPKTAILQNQCNPTIALPPKSPLIDSLKLLLNNTDEILILFDASMRVRLYNKAAKKYIRNWIEVEVNEGMYFLEIMPQYLHEKLLQLSTIVLGGASHSFDEKIELPEETKIFSSHIKPAFDENGEIAGVICVTKDVTEQRRQEEQLRKVEQRWRFALEGSNHGLWDWDMTNNQVFYSESYNRLYGFEKNTVHPDIDEWKKRVHPEDRPLIEQSIEAHLQSEDPLYESVYRLQDSKGAYRWIMARGMIVERDSAGAPSRMIGTHTDISEQKKAEEHYRLLFFHHPIPMWIFDPETFKIIQVNNAAIDFYGYSRKEFLNLSLIDLRADFEKPFLKQVLQDLASKTIHKTKTFHQKKSGEVFYAEFTGNSISLNNKACYLVSVVDMTANLSAERELKKSNERFELAAEAAAEVLWEWEIENDHLYLSPVYKEMFGHEADRKFDDWHEYIHPEDREETIKSHYAAIDDPAQKYWEHEYRYLKADGSYMHVVDRCIIKRNEVGKAIKAVGAMQNVEKRKRAEQKLIASNERFKLATKATSDAIYDWDISTNELQWGEGLYSLFGYNSEDVTIENWEILIHPHDREKTMDRMNAAIQHKKKKFWKAQYRFLKENGEYSYVLDRGFLVRDEEGRALRLIGAMQDITDQKLKEAELIKSNDRYKYATLATSEIIWDWRLDQKNILWSDNYERVLGWTLPENNVTPDDNCILRFHPDDRDRVTASLRSAIEAGKSNLWHEEFRYLKADNTYAYISDKGYVIRNEQGEATRMIGAMQDVTEKKYQEALQELERKIFELSADNGSSLELIVETLLKGIEQLHPQMITSVMLLASNQTMRCIGGPTLPEKYRLAVNGSQIGPFEGSCGSAMYHKTNVVVEDIAIDPVWKKYQDLAAEFGFKACWSLPIIDRNLDVMGCFGIYHREAKLPGEVEFKTIERVRDLFRILMENHLSLNKIIAANKRFDSVMQATHDLIWDWDLETGSFYRDREGMKKVYGIESQELIGNIHTWMQRIHPDDHQKVQAIITSILQTSEEKVFELEYRFLRDDGKYNYVYDRGFIIRNEEGKPIRMVGAAQDVSERKRLEQELLQRELEKQKLISKATLDTQEQERGEIGKELHDNVNQVLTTTKLYLDLTMSNPEMQEELIKKSSKNIIYVINEIRQLSRSLMNPSLGDLGLYDALNDLVENINLTQKLNVLLETCQQAETDLAEATKLTIFRIIQEALNNAMKHAQAKQVKIKLENDGSHLHLTITDDGVGFIIQKVRKGAGLKNIQNRVYLANGILSIDSSPGKGCNIDIKFDLNHLNNPS